MSTSVWLLIIALGHPHAIAVPGISTETECHRLAKAILAEWGEHNAPRYTCTKFER